MESVANPVPDGARAGNKKINPISRARKKHVTDRIEGGITAPSDVSERLIRHLAKQFSPDYITKKIAALCEATHVTKGGHHIADNRAQEAGIKLLLAYLVGLPVQRQEIVQVQIDGAQLQERAAMSPAIQKAAARLLEMNGMTVIPPAKDREKNPE